MSSKDDAGADERSVSPQGVEGSAEAIVAELPPQSDADAFDGLNCPAILETPMPART